MCVVCVYMSCVWYLASLVHLSPSLTSTHTSCNISVQVTIKAHGCCYPTQWCGGGGGKSCPHQVLYQGHIERDLELPLSAEGRITLDFCSFGLGLGAGPEDLLEGISWKCLGRCGSGVLELLPTKLF